MGILGNLFKPKSQTEEDANRSTFIMERLKAHRGAETGKWLALMEHSSQVVARQGELAAKPTATIDDVDNRETIDEAPYSPPIEAQYVTLGRKKLTRPAAEPSQSQETNETVEWVNKLFAEFTRQSTDYNATAAGTQLDLTVHPPEFKFEAAHFDKKKKMNVFKGHVSTLHWAMLVQGCEDKIDVYVIPGDEILNFTLNDVRKSKLTPFMTIASSLVNSHRLWNVGGTTIGPETIPLLAKELLGDLIRIATGTMSEAELFADHATGLRLGETVAHGYSPKQSQQQEESAALPQALQQLTDASLLLAQHQFGGAALHEPESFTIASGAQGEQPFLQRGGADASPDQLDKLSTWFACETLLKAIDKDLALLTSAAGSLDSEKDKATAKRLHDLSAVLRTLSGQVSGCLAENHPSAGSKYNAS